MRAAGIGVEVYPEPKKLGQQLKYADRRGFRLALIAGENELAAGTCQIKDLASRRRATSLPLADVPPRATWPRLRGLRSDDLDNADASSSVAATMASPSADCH